PEASRRAPGSPIPPWKPAEFLIFCDSFPRSLHYCAVQVEEFLRRILGETGARPKSDAARAARRLLADLQSLSIADVIDQGLHEFLQEIQTTLDTIGEEVVQTTMFYPAEAIAEEQQQQQQQ
ncbi:MAG: alpha-E domain-containing protein, partial [Undibacterium sp.]|nr:alpha-E domain-containing protein [Opitutaceae bacterium]